MVNRLSAGCVYEFCFDQKQQHNHFPEILFNLTGLLTGFATVFLVGALSCPEIK
jgi:hypothetical protein